MVARADVDDPASLLVGVDRGGALVGTVLFDTDSAVIRPAMQPLLERIAQQLEQRGGGRVVIVGHAGCAGGQPTTSSWACVAPKRCTRPCADT